MADYVRKTILSQAYVHIEGVHLSDQEKEEFEIKIGGYQKPRAERLIGTDIVPQVRTQDGSLKVYATVYGSLSDALGSFIDFRHALDQLYSSSVMLADACNLESLYWSGAPKKAMLRAEARTGIVRAVRDLINRLIYLAEANRTDGHKTILNQIAEVENKIISINQQLTFGRDKVLVWNNVIPLLHNLSNKIHKAQRDPKPDNLAAYKKTLSEIALMTERFSNEGDV